MPPAGRCGLGSKPNRSADAGAASRKERPFADGLVNGSNPTLSAHSFSVSVLKGCANTAERSPRGKTLRRAGANSDSRGGSPRRADEGGPNLPL